MSRAKIEFVPNGPIVVKGLDKLTRSDGTAHDKADAHYLCRCGASGKKPFCDGSHKVAGFTDAKERGETYETKQYPGKELTIVDNVGICCHAGECVRGAKGAFFSWKGDERISNPDGDDKDKIIETIRKCPSGSLAYVLEGKLQDQYFAEEEIFIAKDGPLEVRGAVALGGPASAELISKEHYTLCRCGSSKNKPFCDGTHKKAGFEAD